MRCKICNKNNVIKAGISHGKQRYKCKDCTIHFITRSKRLTEDERMRAVRLCLYGVSMNTVAQLFYVSVTTIARFVKYYTHCVDQKMIPNRQADWIFAKQWIARKPNRRQFLVSLFINTRIKEKRQELSKC